MKKSILSFFASIMVVSAFSQISLVKDIWPGMESGFSNGSHPGIALDDHFIFPAKTSAEGLELWISDGSESGTFLLKDINAGNGDSDPHSFLWHLVKCILMLSLSVKEKNFG